MVYPSSVALQQRFDVLGDDRGRFASFDVRALDGDHDDALQAIVAAAAIATEAPIALVSLVLRRIQLFRAHIGLPPDLAVTRAIDRCVSFCQIVVRTGASLEVCDALGDDRVPQAMVEHYGIRAYLGVPLRIHGRVLGTLCVLDVRPRAFTDAHRVAIERLAVAAAARLAELLPQPETSGRDDLTAAIAGVVSGRISAIEVRARLRALGAGPSGVNALGVITEAALAIGDLEATLATVEVELRHALTRVDQR